MAYELNKMSSVEEFEQYERDYSRLTTELSKKISELSGSGLKPERRADLAQLADKDVYDINGLLKKWEIEIRSLSYHVKSKYSGQLKLYRTSFETQKQDLSRARNAAGRRVGQDNEDSRAKLLEAESALESSDRSLHNTRRALMESEEIGKDVTIVLHQQRQQLQNSRDALKETDDNLNKARKTLTSMGRRVLTDKLTQSVVVLIELGIIGLIVYLKYYK
eukprot:TRINITY_DN1938_c0_g1_i1.p1 TRINITY_DN1938_c0_g1~~TRINITY_DN1938_c0_g1_i1.p1  ORF type:complete len:220 (+),score=32.23 TRINITY_DN1938_c0_g1_i1:80-739(+)